MEMFQELRKKYPVFEYTSYNIEETEDSFNISFEFDVPGLTTFTPKWTFPKPKGIELDENSRIVFENAVFNMGMVELISYQKATCSPNIIVRAGKLNEDQINWWKKLYVNGLGEFFFVNNIVDEMNVETFVEITSESSKEFKILKELQNLSGNIIPVGGGKDSVVTLEALKGNLESKTCYIINPRGASLVTAKIAGYSEENTYTPTRVLDKKLIDLNSKGFLNGHTPFSAIVAFSSYIAAIILKKKHIVLSNESSANEINIAGTNINHQYSKSIEFENDFINYIQDNICLAGPKYFSLLRPLGEWQIVRAFVKTPKYFSDFKSCNVGSKTDIWCENCAKCLYVYIMLAAFLSEEDRSKIFKTNLLDKSSLKDIFNGLVLPDYNKPFECVGTKEEIDLAVNMIIDNCIKEGKKLPYLLKDYEVFTESKLTEKIKEATNAWNSINNLSPIFEQILKDYIK